jgi:chaperonin GroEL
VVLNAVRAGKGAYGYNVSQRRVWRHARGGHFRIRPRSRVWLCRTRSVAGLLLTTEVMIADAPKDEADHGHGGGGGGGMGGMGDMGMKASLTSTVV